MSGLSEERGWTDDQAGWVSVAERRIAPLRSAAFAGLALGILLVTAGAAWVQQSSGSGDVPWGPVLCFALALGSLGWGGVAALAFWVCRAVLDHTTSRT